MIRIDNRGEGFCFGRAFSDLGVVAFVALELPGGRHSWTSHKPTIFFESCQVPKTPPSLARLWASTKGVIQGSSISQPAIDHVPELIQKKSLLTAGTAAKPSPCRDMQGQLSGQAMPRSQPRRQGACCPRTLPGSIKGGKRRVGICKDSNRDTAQVRLCGLKHCVVVALVNSQQAFPLNQ